MTAARRTEIGSLGWVEVNFGKRLIELPADRCKNGVSHLVPLSTEAVAILKATPAVEGREFVFGAGEGGFSGWSKAKSRLDATIADARRKAGKKPMPPWRLHDVRRGIATALRERRLADADLVELILAHKRPGVRGIYDRSFRLEERRQALESRGLHHSRAGS